MAGKEKFCLFVFLFIEIYLVHIGYKHNAAQLIKEINIHPLVIVTAAVDRIGSKRKIWLFFVWIVEVFF